MTLLGKKQTYRLFFWNYFHKGEVVGSIQVHVKQSPQHVEVNLSELKGYEKHVIVELMKETQNKIPNKSALPCSLDNCRGIFYIFELNLDPMFTTQMSSLLFFFFVEGE